MRTTLTLDPDVSVRIERLRRERRLSLKQAINETLRRGLEPAAAPVPRRAARTTPVSLGRCYLPDLDDVAEALAAAEGEGFR
jgi:hypothetical protein